MKGWAVMAVVALQAVAQTTAMVLLSGEESRSSRRSSAERSLDTRTAGNGQEEKTSIGEKMVDGAVGSGCNMGKAGKECFFKREAEPSFSTMLNKARMSTMVKLINQKLSLASNRKKREAEDLSENEALVMARLIEGGHQPPTEKSRVARDTRESVVSSIVTREDESSALSKGLSGLESASMSQGCSEDQPSVETRGLLSGLLGGGGGGNCTAQGDSVSKY